MTDVPVVLAPDSGNPAIGQRMHDALRATLPAEAQIITRADDLCDLRGRKVLFAFAIDALGINRALDDMIMHMAAEPTMFEGATGAILVDGQGELYTKSLARDMVFRANQSGCTFMGRALIEATGSLQNFELRSELLGMDLLGAYHHHLAQLVERLMAYQPPAVTDPPKLLVIYSTNRARYANSVRFWEEMRQHLDPSIVVRSHNIGKNDIKDCHACSYNACVTHGCPDHDLMRDVLFDEIRACDVLLFLAPNLNDSLGSDLSAFINRLTHLANTGAITHQALYAVIVSGYSGGDLLARQLLNALCLNKNFTLPPYFAAMATANRPLSIVEHTDFLEQSAAFAAHINKRLLSHAR